MSYNGWKNWETWNVALWLGNDEGCYRACVEMARRTNHHDPIDEDHAQDIVRDLMPDGTPDFKSEHHGSRKGAYHYAAVDWDAIAECINEMAGLEPAAEE